MERIKGQEEKKKEEWITKDVKVNSQIVQENNIFRFRMSYSSNSFFKDRVSSANIRQ
jgi:hypothetical protein